MSPKKYFVLISSVGFSRSVMSDSLRPRELQHARPPCPSTTPGVYPNPCPQSRWCHPAISSSVDPFSSCPQSLPASGSFPMSQLFAWGGQSIGVSASASVLPIGATEKPETKAIMHNSSPVQSSQHWYHSEYVEILSKIKEDLRNCHRMQGTEEQNQRCGE